MMTARLLLAVVLPGICLPAMAATGSRAPTVELDRQTLALGEPLQLRITRDMQAAGTSLDRLDLKPLQRDFDIQEQMVGRDDRREVLTVTLYPRRAGRITLPALGQFGRAVQVTVSDGSSTVSRVQWKLSLDPPEPLLRQPVTFTLEACDDGTLLWKRPQLSSVEGLLLRPLNETEIITTRDGQRCTAHRWHWALVPTVTGAIMLPLPVLEAGKFGRRLRFAPPALELTVKPLALWVPSQAAAGQATIEAEPLPAQAVLDQPMAWRLRVSGAYSAQALQNLLALQLQQGDARLGLATYAPLVEPLPAPAAAPLHRITLFVLPNARGSLELPALQLPWYDADSARMMYARLPATRIEVLDPVRQRWLMAGAVGVAALLAVALSAGAWRWLGWRLRRARVLKQMKRAPNTEALCRALQSFSFRADLQPTPTLRSWQQRMEQQSVGEGLEALVLALEQARFASRASETLEDASAGPDHASLMEAARAWLEQARPRRFRPVRTA